MLQLMPRPTHLFFYGVLQEELGDWPFLEGLGLGSPASTQGALYAIPDAKGWYPALIPTQARYASNVEGMIYPAGTVDLAAIDAFEGPDYTRAPIMIDGWDGYGETEADAYLWTADLPEGAEPIAGGNFAGWLKQTGRKPFAG